MEVLFSLHYLLAICTILCARATCQELRYQLGVSRFSNIASDRRIDIITLQCSIINSGEIVMPRQNQDIRFWLNRTDPNDAGLRSRFPTAVHVNDAGTGITFSIRDVGEGNYSCGVRLNDGNVDESVRKPLIALQTVFNSVDVETDYFVASGNSVVLQCPVQPGDLYGFYYGVWLRGNTPIIWIDQPSMDGTPGAMMGDTNKFNLDRETFSLTVNFADVSEDASLDYRCELRQFNPLTGFANIFNAAALISISLMVNEQPSILSKPEPFIIGLQEASATPPTFTCSVGGAPEPQLSWTYIPNLSGDELTLRDGEEYNITRNVTEEDNGRTVVTSTITFLSISNTDGGIVRCSTGPEASITADTLLTILGTPEEVEVIVSSENGLVIYEFEFPADIEHPFMINITYTNKENSSHSMITDTIYNNTKSVTHRDIISQLEDRIFFVSFALIAVRGSDRIQGPLTKRDEIIDTTDPPDSLPLDIIIPTTVVGGVGLFVIVVVLIAVILLFRYKKDELVFDSIHEILEDPDKYLDKVKFPEDKKEREEYMKKVRKAHMRLICGKPRKTRGSRTDGDGDDMDENGLEFFTELLYDSQKERSKLEIKNELRKTSFFKELYNLDSNDDKESMGQDTSGDHDTTADRDSRLPTYLRGSSELVVTQASQNYSSDEIIEMHETGV